MRGIAQMVARTVRDREVAGSSPVAPTKKNRILKNKFFMKQIVLNFLKSHTDEYTENSIIKQIIILYKKFRHHNYHNDFFRYGRLVIILLLLFLSVFYFIHYISDQKNIDNHTVADELVEKIK